MRTLAALLAALVLVPAASAKEGVVARLVNPDSLRAPAGTTITLRWTLRAGNEPFTAQGIYVRVNAGREIQAKELMTGRFQARLRIPPGGVHRVVIALMGWRTDARGTRRTDWRFPIVNDPTR